MEPQKASVREDGITMLKCPFCGLARTVSVAKIKDNKKVIKVKCACQKSYSVSLELWRMYRKSTNLNGKYINLSVDNASGMMVVKNVSISGIGFETMGRCNIEVDHELEVTFTLDDTHSSVIKKKVVARRVRDKFVGCEFLHAHDYDKALGFYLLP